jgi:hypothetical protein
VKRVKRWKHEGVLDAMQARLDRMPEAMGVRRQTVEHPFGTLKAWMGATHFLTRTLDKVRTEMSLHVLADNLSGLQPQANDHDLRCGTADGGHQNLIALSRKPPIDHRRLDRHGGKHSAAPTSHAAFFHGLGHDQPNVDRWAKDCSAPEADSLDGRSTRRGPL